jgi:hypothetical protein
VNKKRKRKVRILRTAMMKMKTTRKMGRNVMMTMKKVMKMKN